MVSRRTRLLASTIFAGASALAVTSGATAQTSSGASAAPQEITVTGTRIRQPNLTSVSPLTVVNDTEIKLQGAANIENLLNALPQITAGQQSNVSNGSTGTATVNLRNLGAQRTLVLVDGKRLMPGDPGFPIADLNNIPSAVVERVDVVTGGASAVYGADAVAGVVNFIMKKNFQGAQIDAQYGFAQHKNDNGAYRSIQGVQGISTYPYAPGNFHQDLSTEVSALIGLNSPDDKGNITAYATYRNLQAVTQDKYDVSACSVASATNNPGGDSYNYNIFRCSGSSNTQYGRFIVQNPSPGSFNAANPGRQLHDNPAGGKTFVRTAVPAFSYGPLNYLQRPEERYSAGFFGHYRFNDHAEFYTDLMFADDHTVAQIAPSGFFAGSGSNGNSYIQINCNNPLMGDIAGPTGQTQRQDFCGVNAGTPALVNVQTGFRFVGSNRQDDIRHTNYKIDLGLRGDLAPGWSYDAYLQYGTSIYNEHYLNDVSIRKAQNAVLVDPATGKCFTDAGNCVPLNIFQVGGPSAAALAYVLTPGFKSGQAVEQIASASITGDLGQYGMKSPWAHGGVGVALGTEYRRESSALNVDDEFRSGDLSGQGGPTKAVSGSFDVYELFGELRVPIVEDRPFFKSLNLDVGYRFSDYSLAGTTNTYKIEGDWSITRDLRFRAGYNRAVRAPNVVELFAPASVGNTAAADPCSGNFIAGNISSSCLATFAVEAANLGLTPQQFVNSLSNTHTAAGTVSISQCPAAQCSGLFAGNQNLKPEQADTFTVGVVFTPTFSFLRRFSATLDYFNIEVDNVIGAPGSTTVLNECTNFNVAAACALIKRDASGILFGFNGYTNLTNTNQGYLKTSGYDVTANYRFDPRDWSLPAWGTLSINMIGTYTDKLISQPLTGGPTFDCAGLYGPTCGTPQAHWKHKVRFTFEPSRWPLTISFDWRYMGAVKFDANEGNAGALPFGSPPSKVVGNSLLANHPSGVTDTVDSKIGAYNYLDISGTWKVRPNLLLRAGVANVLDKDPPRLDSNITPASGPPTGNANTYPGVYDTLGRVAFVGLTLDF